MSRLMFYEGRDGRPAVREGRLARVRGQGHGGSLLRGGSRRARARGKRKALGVRQLPATGQAAAPWAQPEDRRGDPDQRASRRDLPRQPEIEGHGREGAPWSKAAGKLNFRRFTPSATTPSVTSTNWSG